MQQTADEGNDFINVECIRSHWRMSTKSNNSVSTYIMHVGLKSVPIGINCGAVSVILEIYRWNVTARLSRYVSLKPTRLFVSWEISC